MAWGVLVFGFIRAKRHQKGYRARLSHCLLAFSAVYFESSTPLGCIATWSKTLANLRFFPKSHLGNEAIIPELHRDDRVWCKETHVVEGGYLDLGFVSYMVGFEVIRKSDEDSIIKSTIEYEVDEEFASNASLISTAPLAMIHETVGKYLIEKKSSA